MMAREKDHSGIFKEVEYSGRTWVLIPETTWGDYCGSLVGRANSDFLSEKYAAKYPEDEKIYSVWVQDLDWKRLEEDCPESAFLMKVESWSKSSWFYGLKGHPEVEKILGRIEEDPLLDEARLWKLEDDILLEYLYSMNLSEEKALEVLEHVREEGIGIGWEANGVSVHLSQEDISAILKEVEEAEAV